MVVAPAPVVVAPAPAAKPAPAPAPQAAKKAPAQTKKAPAAKQAAADDEFDWETFLALPTLILFWVVTYAVLQEEEED